MIIKTTLPQATISILGLLALFTAGVGHYGWGWTGFLAFSTPAGDSETNRPAKTLWDLLELLIIPIVLVAGGFLLNRAQRQNTLDITREENLRAPIGGVPTWKKPNMIMLPPGQESLTPGKPAPKQ